MFINENIAIDIYPSLFQLTHGVPKMKLYQFHHVLYAHFCATF